jgi:general secretion pathway protein D
MRLFFEFKSLSFVISMAVALLLVSLARAQQTAVPPLAAAEADGAVIKRLEQTMSLAKLTDEADQLLAARSIESARSRYQQILNQTQPTGPLAQLNSRASKGLGMIAAYQARQAMDKKDYAQARQLWEQASGYDPANTTYQAAYARVREQSKSATEQYPSNTAVTSELQDKVNQIQKLIFEGDSYIQTGQYVRAVARYKAVLLLDQYNDQARQRIKKAELLREQVATVRMKQRKEGALNQVEEAWSIQPQATVGQLPALSVGAEPGDNTANVYDKLQNIVIPECKFTDADLADILSYMQDQSKVIDSKKEGVNFVFKGEPTSSSETAADVAAVSTVPMIRSLTLDLKDVSLVKILDLIQTLSTYKYKVDEHAVYVFPNTETSEVMLVRTFSVPPQFFSTTVRTDDTSVGAMGQRTVTMATADVKKELAEKGVSFASGASAAYLPKTAKLVVRNTLDQLNLIDQLLNREANVSTQVEISAKFLDFSMDKLKDISSNISVNPIPQTPINFLGLTTDGRGVDANGYPVDVRSNNRNQFGAATALRGSGDLLGNPLDALLGRTVNRDPNVISLIGIVDGAGAQLLVNALISELGADLMSEPKMTLFNGQKSKFRAVREFRYPTQWDAPKIPTTGGGGGSSTTSVTVIPSNPTNFVIRDVGVTLEVKANATPDRRIDLDINPDVTEFQGFINYGGDATTLSADGEISSMVEGVALTPVFALRSVKTLMQVVDGQTVVMGGFIRSDNQEIEDKVPLLGDIPLVGRLFRSTSSQVVKRNLVIFLTARMIRPDGRYEYMTEGEKELSEVTALPVTQVKQ